MGYFGFPGRLRKSLIVLLPVVLYLHGLPQKVILRRYRANRAIVLTLPLQYITICTQ